MILTDKKLYPLKGKVLAEDLTGDYVTESGLQVIQGDANAWPSKLRIVAVGDPFTDKKGKPKEYFAGMGDTIIIKKATGQMVWIGRKKYLFLKNEEIVARLK